jgi:regulator of protease activity HflC (stomatin/prohibitin superfamily)
MVMTVPSGQVGVLWERFRGGTVLDPHRLRDEGFHIILPWDKLFLYDLRLKSETETYNAISLDGVSLTATLNVRFRLAHDLTPQVHQAVGPEYIKLLVLPEIGSRTREIIAKYTAEDIYSTKRQEVENKIREVTKEKLGAPLRLGNVPGPRPNVNLLDLYDTLLLNIELPASVVAAINRKIDQFYLVQEYAFRVERERKESERKIIEANGVAEFQRIISRGISDSYLRWRGIEATLALSQSSNSKVVVIGGGRDGLPIILGNIDSPPALRVDAADAAKNGPIGGAATSAAQASGPRAPASVTSTPGSSSTSTLSEIEAMLSRMLGAGSKTDPVTKQPAQDTGTEQPR